MKSIFAFGGLFLLLVAVVALAWFWARKESRPLKGAFIQQGPIRHHTLDDSLIARIQAIKPVFEEFYPVSHQKWLEGFQRDLNPENEVVIWEDLAKAYSEFVKDEALDAAQRREAFGLLLVHSATENFDSIFSEVKYLSRQQAEKLLSLYSAPPKPVLIESVGSK
jgi:hypothetical protein